MPDTKISFLTELTTMAGPDEIAVVDKSDTSMAPTGTTKRVTFANLLAGLNLTNIQSPADVSFNSDSDSNNTGDIIFRTKNVERARFQNAGTLLVQAVGDYSPVVISGLQGAENNYPTLVVGGPYDGPNWSAGSSLPAIPSRVAPNPPALAVSGQVYIQCDTLGNQFGLILDTRNLGGPAPAPYQEAGIGLWQAGLPIWNLCCTDVGTVHGAGKDLVLVNYQDPNNSLNNKDIIYISYENSPRISINYNISDETLMVAAFRVGGDLLDRATCWFNNNITSATWNTVWSRGSSIKTGIWNDGSMTIGAGTQPLEMLEIVGRAKAQAFRVSPGSISDWIAGTTITYPLIYSGGGPGGVGLFTTAGHLFIQPRVSAAGTWDIYFATQMTAPPAAPAIRLALTGNGDAQFFGSTETGSGRGSIAIGSATTAPTTTPAAGTVLLYVASSMLLMRNSGGAVGVLTPGHSVKADAYSASITPATTAGDYHTITVTNATAFTINNPSGPVAGMELTFEILNSSGGAMGVITWGAAYLLDGTWVNPANTKRRVIKFRYNGTNWVQWGPVSGDI